MIPSKPKIIEVTCECCGAKFNRRRHTLHCPGDQLIFFNIQHKNRYYANDKIKIILSPSELRNSKFTTGVKANIVGGLRFE